MTPPAEQSAVHDEDTGGAPDRSPVTSPGPAGDQPPGKHAKAPEPTAEGEQPVPPEPTAKPDGVTSPGPADAATGTGGMAKPGTATETSEADGVARSGSADAAAGASGVAKSGPAGVAGSGSAEVLKEGAAADSAATGAAKSGTTGTGAAKSGTADAAVAAADVAESGSAAHAAAATASSTPPAPSTPARTPAKTEDPLAPFPEPGAVAAATARKGALTRALTALRDQLNAFDFVLDVPGVAEAREARTEIRNQLEDYVLPRVQAAGKPMLVVLGGSTGAGKSTLVNTLVGARVSATGVLRPTTSSPILVCHPDHADWFLEGPMLPGMGRVRGPAPDAIAGDQLVIIASDALPPGLALLDSPDFDSVFEDHYEFATKLMAAADLWLCVTTAARYADAQVWQMLQRARDNGATIGVVLSRVPDGGGSEVVEHFGEMLTEQGVGDAHRFTIPETRVEGSRLPEETVADIRSWLVGVADSSVDREVVIGDTLGGVLDSFRTRVPELAKQVEAQVEQRAELARAVESAYATALAELDEATRNGSLLRGEVLARWQDFAGTGDLLRSLHVRRGRGPRRTTTRRHRSPARVRALKAALRSGLESLILSSAEHAADQVLASWREHPAGGHVLDAPAAAPHRAAERVSPELSRRVTRAVSSWQDHVQELIRTEGVTKRSVAKLVSFDSEALSLVLMIGLLGYGTADVNVEGGTSAVPQRLLKALFGAESLRGMGAKARADLRSRIGMLFDEEAIRFGQALDAAGIPDQNVPVQLYQATYNLEVAR
ncbi:AAA family ATPase [Actinomadura hibisca]|uniref:AAA family ATPase n=1 Tax=Actinomadura hibisca TaxID=68565 RepID=UPI000A9C85E2|nr:AAA family ATPase [Actinomadura hibisca]